MSNFSDDGWGFENDAQVKATPPKPYEEPVKAPTPIQNAINRTIELEKPAPNPPVLKANETPIMKRTIETNVKPIPQAKAMAPAPGEESDDGWGTPEKKKETYIPTIPKPTSTFKLPPASKGFPAKPATPVQDDTIVLDIDDTIEMQPEKPVKKDIMPPRAIRPSSRKGSDFSRPIPIIATEPPIVQSFGGPRPTDDRLPSRSFGISVNGGCDVQPPPSFGSEAGSKVAKTNESNFNKYPANTNEHSGEKKSFGFGSQNATKPSGFGGNVHKSSEPVTSFGGGSRAKPSGFGGPKVNEESKQTPDETNVAPTQPASFGETPKPNGFGSTSQKPSGFGGAQSDAPSRITPSETEGSKSVGFGAQRSDVQNTRSFGFGTQRSEVQNTRSAVAPTSAVPRPSSFGTQRSEPSNPRSSGFGVAVKTETASSAEFGGRAPSSTGFGGKQAATAGFERPPSSGSGRAASPPSFGGVPASTDGFGGKPISTSGMVKGSSGFGGKPAPTSSFGGERSGEKKPIGGFGNSANSGFGNSGNSGFGNSGNSGFGNSGNSGFGASGGGGVFGKADFGEPPKTSFGNSSSRFGVKSGGGVFGENDDGFGDRRGERERGTGCFNCGQDGHRSSDCTEPKKPSGCRRCGEEGHFAKNCPHAPEPTGPCRNCGIPGHWKSDCTEPPKQREPCRNCGQDGHWAKECKNERVRIEPTAPCRRCGEEGHWGSECPTRPTDLQGNLLVPYEVVFTPEDEIFDDAVDNDSRMDFDQKVVASMGDAIIPDMASFEGFKVLATEISDNLKRMKINRPTAIQRAAFFPILNGSDVVACAHTGCGKTLAFLIPLATKLLEDVADCSDIRDEKPSPLLLIVAPTRELANQTFNTARQLTYHTGLNCCLAYGGYSRSSNIQHLHSSNKVSILVATMGRLQDFLESGEISLSKMKYVVLDEADRMVDSTDFGEEVTKILGPPEDRTSQTLLFSASFSENLQREDLPKFVKKGYTMLQVDKFGTANRKIDQRIQLVNRSNKKSELYKLIGVDEDKLVFLPDAPILKEKTLIFVNTVKFSDSLAAEIAQTGINAIAMHSHQNQENRDRILDDFRRGKWQCMVASNVCARGLNIVGLDHVINYHMPDKAGFDEYVNRIGRTGRAGYSGKSTAFIDEEMDREIVPELIRILTEAEKEVPEWLTDLHVTDADYKEEEEDQW